MCVPVYEGVSQCVRCVTVGEGVLQCVRVSQIEGVSQCVTVCPSV